MSEIIFGSSLRGLPNINPEGYGEFRPACGPSADAESGGKLLLQASQCGHRRSQW
jgi:hypothetical protein